MRFKWHRRKKKDRVSKVTPERRLPSSLLTARRAVFLLASRLPTTLRQSDATLIGLINQAATIAAKADIDDFLAWREWDGLAGLLPNYTVRQLIKQTITYERPSSTTSGTSPDSSSGGQPTSAIREG